MPHSTSQEVMTVMTKKGGFPMQRESSATPTPTHGTRLLQSSGLQPATHILSTAPDAWCCLLLALGARETLLGPYVSCLT